MKYRVCLTVVVATLALTTFAAAQTCSFQLFKLNGYATVPTRIDHFGNVVGWAYDSHNDTIGFIRYAANAQIVRYSVPNSTVTQLYDRNSSGMMVGTFQDTAGNWHGFVLYNGTVTQVDHPGAAGTSLNGINDNGVMVGDYWTPSNHNYVGFVLNAGTFTAFVYPNSEWTVPQGINNSGEITGAYGTMVSPNWNGFVLQNGAFTTLNDPLGAYGSWLGGSNNQGEIAGVYQTSSESAPEQAFFYKNGTFTNISIPNAMFDIAAGVNDSGLIVGSASFSDGYHGYVATCH